MRLGAIFVALAIAAISFLPAQAQQAPYRKWTGCYGGLYVGGAFSGGASAKDLGDSAGLPWNPPLGNRWSYGLSSSAIAGGTVGCTYQTDSPLALGGEIQAGYIDLSGSGAAPDGPHGDTVSHAKIGSGYAVIAPRLGWAFGDALAYGKFGAVIAQLHTGVIDTCPTFPCGGGAINAGAAATRVSWAAGGGVEYAIDERWSVKAEYLYLAIDDSLTSCGVATAGVSKGTTFCFGHKSSGAQTASLGFTYKFWIPDKP